jgi:arsenite-transporting ATPase
MAIIKSRASPRQTRFIFFAGKGGVGKTSLSAATALWLSRKGHRTLIISTDPAHSLSDSFCRHIGPKIEIEPGEAIGFRDAISPGIGGLGLGDSLDSAANAPGMDEIASFDLFLKYMNSEEFDYIIFDTAPTGHTLRLLSLPDILDTWLGRMIMMRMRFAGLTGAVRKLMGPQADAPDTSLQSLEEMKRRIARAKSILQDSSRTGYNIVLIPESMSILESVRSERVLSELGIKVGKVIINEIIPENAGCRFCSDKRKQQLERIREIRRAFSGNEIIRLELFKEEVRGRSMLERVASELYSSNGSLA